MLMLLTAISLKKKNEHSFLLTHNKTGEKRKHISSKRTHHRRKHIHDEVVMLLLLTISLKKKNEHSFLLTHTTKHRRQQQKTKTTLHISSKRTHHRSELSEASTGRYGDLTHRIVLRDIDDITRC